MKLQHPYSKYQMVVFFQNSAHFCSCALITSVNICKCFQIWEIYFATQSALCNAKVDTSIYNIWWITFHLYVLQGSVATFSFMADNNLC